MKRRMTAAIVALLLVMGFAAAPSAAQDERMGQVMMSVMEIDLNNSCSLIWWTEEVWAFMAHSDPGPDAMYGYYMMKSLLNDYIFLSAINPQTQGACENIYGTPLIRNSDGIGSAAVPTHDALQKIMPGLIAFPNRDLLDRPVVGDSTESYSVEIKYDNRREANEYFFDVPPDYPGFVSESVEAMKKRETADPATMDEGENLFRRLAPRMKTDIRAGIIAAPLSRDFFEEYFQNDDELRNDPEAMAEAMKLVRDYSFFILIPADENRTRIEEAAASAIAIDTSGKVANPDDEIKRNFMDSAGFPGDVFEVLVFPQLGRYGVVNLILRDPESKKLTTFEWSE